MNKVWWQPPAHQSITSPDHPQGHDCDICTTHYPPQVAARRLTRKGAERRARRLNDWSLTPGQFYAEGAETEGSDEH